MATIIRTDASQPARSGRSVQPVAFSFADMGGRADDYVAAVRQEAATIVGEAHAQAALIRRQAEAAGRKAAEDAIERILEEKVAKRMERLLPTLEQLLAQIEDVKGELLSQWERSAVGVAAAIAGRIIRRQLDREPQIKLELIADALRLATGGTELTLHVNDADYAELGPQIEHVAISIRQVAPTNVVADPEISPGGCRVRTQCGVIDHQIEAQLRRIEEDLE